MTSDEFRIPPEKFAGRVAALPETEREMVTAFAAKSIRENPFLRDAPAGRERAWENALFQLEDTKQDPEPSAIGTGADTEWPEPVPIAAVNAPPPFPTEHLPHWMSALADGLAIELQIPPALGAQNVLGAVSAAIARKAVTGVRENWHEPVNLWPVTAVEPGGKKTPSFRIPFAPLFDWEAAQRVRVRDAIAIHKNKKSILDQELEGMRRKAANATGAERDKLMAETEDLSKSLAAEQTPVAPRLVAMDATPEAVAMLLHEHGGRMALIGDEGGIFKILAGRYSADGGPNMEVFLKGHPASTPHRIDRKGRERSGETLWVPMPTITMALLVQPSVIAGLRARPEFRGEGLLGRFLYALPTPLTSRDPWPPEMPASIGQTYRANLTRLIELEPARDEHGNPVPHVMKMSTEAQQTLIGMMARIMPRAEMYGDLWHINDWADKAPGATVRIAAVLHIADNVDHPAPWTIPLSGGAMRRAVRLMEDFYLPHALIAFDVIGANAVTARARAILDWVRTKRIERFKRSDSHRALAKFVEEPEDWDRPIAHLESTHWVRREGEPTKTEEQKRKGGAPSKGTFVVTPHLLRGEVQP